MSKFLAVFDLDYTLWPFNADQVVCPPLRLVKKGVLRDKLGNLVALYPEIREILAFLRAENVTIGIASKDRAPGLCREILTKHQVINYFDPNLIEIYPCGTKCDQFDKFWKLGWKPKNTFFFDDSRYNIKCLQKVGVHSVLVTQKEGATLDLVKAALEHVRNSSK